MHIKKYTIVKDSAFDMEHLFGFEKLRNMLDTRGWAYLNKMIKETSETIGFEFYVNAYNRESCEYTSYVRGKSINFSP